MRPARNAPPLLFVVALGCTLAGPLTAGGEAEEASASNEGHPPATPRSKGEEALAIERPIACRDIKGYEDFEELPDAALTSEEKLLVYYRPSGYRVEREKAGYRVHLVQDGQVRRRGEERILLRKAKLFEYQATTPGPPTPIYLRNTIALKGLKPGEYDFDIILHDLAAEGATARATLPFRIVAPKLPVPEAGTTESEGEPKAAPPSPRPRRRPR